MSVFLPEQEENIGNKPVLKFLALNRFRHDITDEYKSMKYVSKSEYKVRSSTEIKAAGRRRKKTSVNPRIINRASYVEFRPKRHLESNSKKQKRLNSLIFLYFYFFLILLKTHKYLHSFRV
jgi:hypothetical protein